MLKEGRECVLYSAKRAFSLIELVIVVVIIGIIGAIAIPRMSRGSAGANDGALQANLAALRNAIELYAAEHGNAYPGFHRIDGSMSGNGDEDDFYAQLTQFSSFSGVTGTRDSAATPPRIYGPYLRNIPFLNIGKNSASDRNPGEVKFKTEVPLDEHEGDKAGWIYNPENGEIIANTQDLDEEGTPYKNY